MPKPMLDTPPSGTCVCSHEAHQHAYGYEQRLGVCRACLCNEYANRAWWARALRFLGFRA